MGIAHTPAGIVSVLGEVEEEGKHRTSSAVEEGRGSRTVVDN